MTNILHIDTSGNNCHILLGQDGKVIAELIQSESRNHGAAINLMIETILKENGIQAKNLDAVAVIGGPGSYTGLRIGLATAKGICYAFDKPLILHNKLDLLALELIKTRADEFIYYVAILPAREGEYFMSIRNKSGSPLMNARHIFKDELMAIILEKTGIMMVSGLINKTIHELFEYHHIHFIEKKMVENDFWLEQGIEDFFKQDFASIAYSEPLYLKQVFTHNKIDK